MILRQKVRQTVPQRTCCRSPANKPKSLFAQPYSMAHAESLPAAGGSIVMPYHLHGNQQLHQRRRTPYSSYKEGSSSYNTMGFVTGKQRR